MRVLISLVLAAALLAAGCGGDDEEEEAAQTTPSPPATTETTETTPPPTATTNEPPGAKRGPPPKETVPEPAEGQTVRPAEETYRCGGKKLRALDAPGPVEVRPKIVRPGESFTVVVSKGSEAIVNLTGVSDEPISRRATASGGALRATLRMPGNAACGNKLLTIEGDVSAEAYLGVTDD